MNALAVSNTEAEKRLKSRKMPLRKLEDCLREEQGPLDALSEDKTPPMSESGRFGS